MSLYSLTFTKKRPWHWAGITLAAGFTVFAMFFGSGNLVFPILVGTLIGPAYLYGIVGLIISGIFIPSLGLFGIIKYQGSVDAFFARVGKSAPFIFPLLMLSLLGPFGVLPRCITVSHASFEMLFEGFPLLLFSALFCLITFFILQKNSRFIEIIGGVLTPILLASLGLVIWGGLQTPIDFSQAHSLSALQATYRGIAEGYQTMDLLAAFFFASTIIQTMNEKFSKEILTSDQKKNFTLIAIAIGGGLLALIYGFLVYLGALYERALVSVSPEKYIGIIAQNCLGENASLVICLLVIMACLTTTIALAKIAAQFTHEKILRGKISYNLSLGIILGITILFSLLKFKGIIAFLNPILEVLYPSLILLCVLNIFTPTLSQRWLKRIIYTSIACFGLLKGLGYF